MRRIRQIESGFVRLLLAIGAFLLVTLLIAIAIGVLNSNLIWGEANQDGRVPIPGRKALDLPAGKVQINVAAALPGRGNETPELLVPKLAITLVPPKGVEEPEIERSIGSSTNANDNEVDTQRRIAYARVATAGTYLAVVRGDFTGYGVNAQLWFGHEPAPIHGVAIWFVAMGIAALLAAIGYGGAALRRMRKRRAEGETAPTSRHAGHSASLAIERVAELESRRAAGEIDDATFATERKRIEAEMHAEREGVS